MHYEQLLFCWHTWIYYQWLDIQLFAVRYILFKTLCIAQCKDSIKHVKVAWYLYLMIYNKFINCWELWCHLYYTVQNLCIYYKVHDEFNFRNNFDICLKQVWLCDQCTNIARKILCFCKFQDQGGCRESHAVFTGEVLYTKSVLSKALQHWLKHIVEAFYNSSLLRHHRVKVHCLKVRLLKELRFIVNKSRSLASVTDHTDCWPINMNTAYWFYLWKTTIIIHWRKKLYAAVITHCSKDYMYLTYMCTFVNMRILQLSVILLPLGSRVWGSEVTYQVPR